MTYEIMEYIGELSSAEGWAMELNKVSWHGQPEKFDIREWSENHSISRRGVYLTEKEIKALNNLIENYFCFQLNESQLGTGEDKNMIYYTKCGREFQKPVSSETTGYWLDEKSDGTLIDPECATCPFVRDVKAGYPQVHIFHIYVFI